ncbi:hypothetical protein CHUAL_007523 [Chamberlinius hualienensis]
MVERVASFLLIFCLNVVANSFESQFRQNSIHGGILSKVKAELVWSKDWFELRVRAPKKNTMYRILSIQSHVVHGYVGNKCATFPLQLLGFEVDNLNSVQLSNHTGYKYFKGQVLNSNELNDLIDGLKLNHLQNYTHILTGYVGSPSFLTKVVEVVKEFKKSSPNLTYVCDPVLGDHGKLYVPEANLPIYIDQLIPMADIMTPNQYETEWLTGVKVENVDSAIKAMDWFHEKGVRVVVITSSTIPHATNPDTLTGFASQVISKDGVQKKERLQFHIPLLAGQFTGVGDLFTAVFTAWMAKTDQDLKASCEKTLSTLNLVMKRTLASAQSAIKENGTPSACHMELQLVNSKMDIEDPIIVITSEKLA